MPPDQLTPAEIRRRNLIPDDAHPSDSASGLKFEKLSHIASLDKLLAMMKYDALRSEQADLRKKGVYRGIGLASKISAYALQDRGFDTVDANLELGLPADTRDYSPAAAILHQLGIDTVRLVTNNPEKLRGLAEFGITVAERVALPMNVTPENERYLRTKRERMGHRFDL